MREYYEAIHGHVTDNLDEMEKILNYITHYSLLERNSPDILDTET